jgi:hypothetical protein
MVGTITRTDPTELTDVRGDQPGAKALPLRGAVHGVVPAAVGLAGVLGAAAASAAG